MARLFTLAGVLGLVSGLAVLSAAPTTAQPATAVPRQTQTVEFTSTPPADADWFHVDLKFGLDYIVSASASSALPVTYSIDPASAGVCQIHDGWDEDPRAAIAFRGPGTCTIRADQAGDEDYLPAEQVSQSFVIERVGSWLSELQGRRGIPGLTPTTFQATLWIPHYLSSFQIGAKGYAGQLVTFSVAGKPVCSGTTNADGVATCSTSLPLAAWIRFRFSASYAGDADYKPATNGTFFGRSSSDGS